LDVDNPAAEIIEGMLLDSDDEMDLESEHDSDNDDDNQESGDEDGRDSGYSSMSSDGELDSDATTLEDEPPHCPNNSPIVISSDDENKQTPMRQHAVSPFPPLVLDSPGPFDDYLFCAAPCLKTKKRFRRTSFKPYEKPKAARRLFYDTI
jgi:hypothetical protein